MQIDGNSSTQHEARQEQMDQIIVECQNPDCGHWGEAGSMFWAYEDKEYDAESVVFRGLPFCTQKCLKEYEAKEKEDEDDS